MIFLFVYTWLSIWEIRHFPLVNRKVKIYNIIVCMFVCMDGWMHGWMSGCMDRWMDVCMYVWLIISQWYPHGRHRIVKFASSVSGKLPSQLACPRQSAAFALQRCPRHAPHSGNLTQDQCVCIYCTCTTVCAYIYILSIHTRLYMFCYANNKTSWGHINHAALVPFFHSQR
jgi:hypothetical protein